MDREKVIKAMQHCIGDNCDGDKWSECEYSGHGCMDALLEDALALLKAQEPRVMTPDEVKNAPEKSVLWLELKPDADEIFKKEIYPFVGSGTGLYSCYCSANTSPMFTDNDVEQYGVEFRCWTSRPTDEQMEAIPWNVQK